MSDFTTQDPVSNDQNYFEYDPGPEAAEKAADRDFSVKEDWYPMTVTKFNKTESKAGNPMVVLEFTAGEGAAKSRYPYKLYQAITDKSKAGIAKLLTALGCEKSETGSFKVDPSKFLGTTVEVFLKPETYEGTTRSKPTSVRAVTGQGQF